MKGKYTAVGAGPCADLITLRGVNALRAADAVLYDRLADETLLEGLAAEKIFVGKTPYRCGVTQKHINETLWVYLSEGKKIVRLKGGDSLIFSRVAEEIAIAGRACAEIEIIPGVTSASSAMARAGGALTDRLSASGVIFITGHCRGGGSTEIPVYDWKSIATSGLTIVVYMGLKNIRTIAEKLINNGIDKDTPALIADCLEQPDEKLTPCTVGDLAGKSAECIGPTIFVIGQVLTNACIMQGEFMRGVKRPPVGLFTK